MGPQALPITLSVSSSAPVSFDLVKEIESGRIANLQALFVDNSANSSVLSVKSSETGITLTLPPYFQGVVPVFGKTLGVISVTTSNASLTKVLLVFLNMPLPYVSWIS